MTLPNATDAVSRLHLRAVQLASPLLSLAVDLHKRWRRVRAFAVIVRVV